MTRVLVSFLGTGPLEDIEKRKYRNAKYKIDDKEYNTPFVSAALVEHLNIEKKIIIGTAKSMWEEYYRYFYSGEQNYDDDLYQQLIAFTSKANHQTTDVSILKKLESVMNNTNVIIIKYGLNKDELKENITKVLEIDDLLDRKDGLYMDVTHGFRSFPLLAQQIVFYLKEVSAKNIKPRTFYYGMLDAVRELGYAPIVDLNIMFEMNEWIIGANQLSVNNNGEKIIDLLRQKDKKLMKLLEEFSNAMSINYMTEVYNLIKQVEEYDLIKINMPEKLIVNKVLMEFKEHFKAINKQSVFQFELSKWFYKKKNYSSAYIALSESIVTMVCENNNMDSVSKSNRDKAKSIIKKIEYKNRYTDISNIRNNIAHSIRGRSNTMEHDIKAFNDHFKFFKSYFYIN